MRSISDSSPLTENPAGAANGGKYDNRASRRATLLVFSDDWGRHPSSCQHLVGHLLDDVDVLWVNTIGMRSPGLNWTTFVRGVEKISGWIRRRPRPETQEIEQKTPRILIPKMWPSFRRKWERRLNRQLLARQIRPHLPDDRPTYAVTTIPIVADLLADLPVEHWTYYCVDDFSVWPGLDSRVMRDMENTLVAKVDQIVAAGDNLAERMRCLGRDSQVISHGVDLSMWESDAESDSSQPNPIDGLETPVVLFWGLIDERLDLPTLRILNERMEKGTIVLAGPTQNPSPELKSLNRCRLIGPVPFAELPRLAHQASVLVMPYADLPVTQAMQPLKLKEYLATGLPTVVNPLPATIAWGDCCDIAQSPEQFAEFVQLRLETGLPDAQRSARYRLREESWESKAQQFYRSVAPRKVPA